MVKSTCDSIERLKFVIPLVKIFEVRIKSLIKNLSLPQLPVLIQLVIKYQKLKKINRTVDSAYSILFICLIFQESNECPMEKTKAISVIKSAILKLFHLHKTEKSLKSTHDLFHQVQLILNNSSQIFELNNEKLRKNPKILYCSQLVRIHSSTPFALSMQAILRILGEEKRISIFSFFTNNTFPLLPSTTSEKIILVLDLDETLGHFDGRKFLVRPGAPEFVQKLSGKYELVLFTTALEYYANYALEKIDLNNDILFRLYRQHLLRDSNGAVKDLRVLGRNLDRVIIIDNDARLFRNQPQNGLQIKSWTGDMEDRELERLGSILLSAGTYEDSANILKRLKKN